MPRHRSAIEVDDDTLQRELKIAEYLCKREEEAISDAETIESGEEDSEEDGSYESDFIDDTENEAYERWKTFDIQSMEISDDEADDDWVPYKPKLAPSSSKKYNKPRDDARCTWKCIQNR